MAAAGTHLGEPLQEGPSSLYFAALSFCSTENPTAASRHASEYELEWLEAHMSAAETRMGKPLLEIPKRL